MLVPRSKAEIRKADEELSAEGNLIAKHFFEAKGFKVTILDTGKTRRQNSGKIPDLLLRYNRQRILCEVKTLTSKGHYKDHEALTHEIAKKIAQLPIRILYSIWYEENTSLSEIDTHQVASAFNNNFKNVSNLPHIFLFDEKIKITVFEFLEHESHLQAYSLGGGTNKTYENIRDLISKANRQLSGRFSFAVPKICFIVNRRTSDIWESFKAACLGDSKFAFPAGVMINSGNAAFTEASNTSVSAVFLIMPDKFDDLYAYFNPFAKVPLSDEIQNLWPQG